jgi:histone acetyltransferase
VDADLQTMERKLQARQYTDVDAFAADVQLIVDNCRVYNQESTIYYKSANTLERDFKAMLRDVTARAGPLSRTATVS